MTIRSPHNRKTGAAYSRDWRRRAGGRPSRGYRGRGRLHGDLGAPLRAARRRL